MQKVLLVDHDEQMLELLSFCLLPLGYQMKKMKRAEEAIEFLSKGNVVELVILEVALPGIDGWEACVRIRAKWDYPIIILTSRTNKSDVVMGLRCGADDYITKPFDDQELLARVGAVLRRRNRASKLLR